MHLRVKSLQHVDAKPLRRRQGGPSGQTQSMIFQHSQCPTSNLRLGIQHGNFVGNGQEHARLHEPSSHESDSWERLLPTSFPLFCSWVHARPFRSCRINKSVGDICEFQSLNIASTHNLTPSSLLVLIRDPSCIYSPYVFSVIPDGRKENLFFSFFIGGKPKIDAR